MSSQGPQVETSRNLELFIELQIAKGALAPGSRLEPIRSAAKRFGVSPTTTAAAYRRLTERGLVIPMGRKGTFVADDPAIPGNHESQVPIGLLDLASGNADSNYLPDLSQFVEEAAAAAEGFGASVVDPVLGEAAIDRLNSEGVAAERIVVTSGALDAVERALEAHLRPGAAVAMEDPGYPWLRSLVAALGLRTVPVQVDDSGMMPDALESVVRGVQAVISSPRAQNPYGSRRSEHRANELKAVIEPMPDLLVIEDDYLAVSEPGPLNLITTDRNAWLLVQSVTKSLGADLRLAWSAGDSLTLNRVQARQQVGQGWVSRILQRTAALILNDEAAMAQVREGAQSFRERQVHLIDALRYRGLTASGVSGMNVWVPAQDESLVVARAALAGFAIRPGQRYRQTADPGVRVTLSNLEPDEVDRLADALTGRNSGRLEASRLG